MSGKRVTEQLQAKVLRIARVHFLLVLALALYIVIADSWALIEPAQVLKRWTTAVIILMVTAVIWYVARRVHNLSAQKVFVCVFVFLDIVLASSLVYAERGMASLSVAMYAVPLATSAVLASRTALFTTAFVCVGAYSLTCIKYFVDFFNEGYKVQLYSTIAFYSAIFFILAALLWIAVRPQSNTS
jgi:hypothetical protein